MAVQDLTACKDLADEPETEKYFDTLFSYTWKGTYAGYANSNGDVEEGNADGSGETAIPENPAVV